MPDIYFVSGHLDLTQEEFNEHYVPLLEEACYDDGRFVVGDAPGADKLAQHWLAMHGARFIVFHMFTSPRHNLGATSLHGGFTTDKDRDEAMTAASTRDIGWVRPGREQSWTAKNLARRALAR